MAQGRSTEIISKWIRTSRLSIKNSLSFRSRMTCCWLRVATLRVIDCRSACGGLVFKAHRLLYHSTLGLRVLKKKKKVRLRFGFAFRSPGFRFRVSGFVLRVSGFGLGFRTPRFGFRGSGSGLRTVYGAGCWVVGLGLVVSTWVVETEVRAARKRWCSSSPLYIWFRVQVIYGYTYVSGYIWLYIYGSGFIWLYGYMVIYGAGYIWCRVLYIWFRVQGIGFRVQGFEALVLLVAPVRVQRSGCMV